MKQVLLCPSLALWQPVLTPVFLAGFLTGINSQKKLGKLGNTCWRNRGNGTQVWPRQIWPWNVEVGLLGMSKIELWNHIIPNFMSAFSRRGNRGIGKRQACCQPGMFTELCLEAQVSSDQRAWLSFLIELFPFVHSDPGCPSLESQV